MCGVCHLGFAFDVIEQLRSAQLDVPDVNVGDIISRQAAIEVADAIWATTGDKNVAKVWDMLRNLPSAQPEQKKGKWIEEIGMLMCSECGEAWGTEQFDEVMSFNFCPNCGAKMEVEK